MDQSNAEFLVFEISEKLSEEGFTLDQKQSLIAKKPLFVEDEEYFFSIRTFLYYPFGLSHQNIMDLFSKANGWLLLKLLLAHYVMLIHYGFSKEDIVAAALAQDGQLFFEQIDEYAAFLSKLDINRDDDSSYSVSSDENEDEKVFAQTLKQFCMILNDMHFNRQIIWDLMLQPAGLKALCEICNFYPQLKALGFASESLLQLNPGDPKGLIHLNKIIQHANTLKNLGFSASTILDLLNNEGGLEYFNKIQWTSKELLDLNFTAENLLYMMKQHEHVSYLNFIKYQFKQCRWLKLTAPFFMSIMDIKDSYQQLTQVLQERVILKVLHFRQEDIASLVKNETLWNHFNAVKAVYPIFIELSLSPEQIMILLEDNESVEAINSLHPLITRLIEQGFLTVDFENLLSHCGGVQQIKLLNYFCSYIVDKDYTKESLLQELGNKEEYLDSEMTFFHQAFANNMKKRKRTESDEISLSSLKSERKRHITIDEQRSSIFYIQKEEPLDDSLQNVRRITLS